MAVTLNYSKDQYIKKINELQAYRSQLSSHLDTMKNLKAQMFDFWNDDDGQKAALALQKTINKTNSMMTQVNNTLVMYQKIVDQYSATGEMVDELLEDALSIISGGLL